MEENKDVSLSNEFAEAENKIKQLKQEIEGEFNDIYLCKKLLREIKIHLTSFTSCSPSPQKIIKEELLLGRECMELGVLISVKNKVCESFERHVALLYPYYVDYHHLLGSSEREFMIKGMYLFYLLAANRLGEFHIYLQQIPIQDRSNEYIKEAIEIEENLMDGNYSKIFDLKKNKSKSKGYMHDDFFIENLLKSVRQKIADCLESSCKSIDTQLATQKLFLNNIHELQAFVDAENNRKVVEEAERQEMKNSSASSYLYSPLNGLSSVVPSSGTNVFIFSLQLPSMKMWRIIENKLHFVPKNEEKKEILALDVVHQLIGYATELERIV